MQTNQQEEEEDDCPICNESLPTLSSKVARMTCCGKGTHEKCRNDMLKSSMSDTQKNQCIMCRTKHTAAGSKEEIDQLRRWVEKGKAWAQSLLGDRYHQGRGVDQSYQQAKELYDLAASQGDAHAQFRLGIQYNNGQGVDQSYEKAAEYYEAAAKQGDADAQSNLGVLYANGQGVEQSFATARAWWMKSAEQGEEDAIKNLQTLDKEEGRTTPSFTPPKRCFTCDTPETPTHKLNDCPCFGAQYCNAKCQTSNWKSHKKEHRRLSKELKLKSTEGEMKDEVVEEEQEGEKKETASVDSQEQEQKKKKEEEDVCPVCIEALQKDVTKFSRMTCCGKGMHIWCLKGIEASSLSREQRNTCPLCRTKRPRSDEEYVEQIRLWVEKGKAWAQSMLGEKYCTGNDVDQSYQRAKELLELAASQANVMAQSNLGVMYANGLGVDQSYARAAEYYEPAAKQGLASAQYKLGLLYYKGQGVEQSNETAREWWMKAAEQGSEQAIKALQMFDKDEGRTTPSFIPKPFECATCYRRHDPLEHKLRPCKGCHQVFYCGKECQGIHWKAKLNGHKQKCASTAKTAKRRAVLANPENYVVYDCTMSNKTNRNDKVFIHRDDTIMFWACDGCHKCNGCAMDDMWSEILNKALSVSSKEEEKKFPYVDEDGDECER